MRRVLLLSCLISVGIAAGCATSVEEEIQESSQALAEEQQYVVLYRGQVPPKVATLMQKAGGRVVYPYEKIGVIIAASSDPAFAQKALTGDKRIDGVSTTKGFHMQLRESGVAAVQSKAPGAQSSAEPAQTQSGDPLAGLQWDMNQIQAPAARAITKGSPNTIVGIIDTGIDYEHPDLAPNIDFERSVGCLGGVPDQSPAAWYDDGGHGTHVAGTVAAAANGIGITGVAPGVKLAALKAGDADGYFFPEAVVCAFVWAADHGIQVTTNSYFVDPWLYNCKNEPEQRAIWRAIKRAVRYAINKGVVVVASAGNESDDVSNPTVDTISPDWPNEAASEREVDASCSILPAEVRGVIAVSATGDLRQKSYYSNYGLNYIDIAAPGGDFRYQVTPTAVTGGQLSSVPSWYPADVQDCSVTPCANYAYYQGTSMAGPHVAGVAALIVSKNPGLLPSKVQQKLAQTADAMPCPTSYLPGTPYAATCEGTKKNNSFYGAGMVNALSAVK